MLELADAKRRILEEIQPLASEFVAPDEADGRFLAENVISTMDLPAFDNSAVDGYAVRSADLLGAASNQPVSLRLGGRISAGDTRANELCEGECARIFTGASLPVGADAVAMQEDTGLNPNDQGCILFSESTKPWENVRFRGEDVKTGALLGKAGTRLQAANLGLLRAAGVQNVPVRRQPLVGILATGSELREPGDRLEPGEIYESNRVALAALARRLGTTPKVFPIVADTLSETKAALRRAFANCDVVVTTGGASVGEMDFVKPAFLELGGTIDFWRVSIKPGKPFVFGKWEGKLLLGLPGNPVSAFVTFILLVAPALARLQGTDDFSWPHHPGILSQSMENRGARRHFVRVWVDAKGTVSSAGTQASHIHSSLAASNGLVEIGPETVLEKGATVAVLRFA